MFWHWVVSHELMRIRTEIGPESLPILQMHDWVTSASTTTPATMATEAPQGPIDRNWWMVPHNLSQEGGLPMGSII